MDPGHEAGPEPSSAKGVAFWAGIGLMIASFSVFAFYLIIPFLPVSLEAMANLLVLGVIASWGLFLLGTFFAGKEGYLYLKRRVASWFRKS